MQPEGSEHAGIDVLRAGVEAVPGYRLVEPLGSGGFGQVWKAEGPGGFSAALKFIELSHAGAAIELRALEIVKRIRHPNLLTTFGTWQVRNYLVLAMELADRTLWDRFREAVAHGLPGIPGPELLEYFREAAKGIDYLNEPQHLIGGLERVRVQHRDIKPQNILLVGSGVKVADFGLARLLEHTVTGHTGALTLAYAAPEFFKGQTSSHSDQYCLAVTYCQLRGGRLPFEGNAAQVTAGHLLNPPDLEMLPEAERPVVARALAKEPAERWPSCRAFVEALAQAHVASPVGAASRRLEPPPSSLPAGPPEAREPVPPSPPSTRPEAEVVTLPLERTAGALPSPAPASRPGRSFRWAWLSGAAAAVAVAGGLVFLALNGGRQQAPPDSRSLEATASRPVGAGPGPEAAPGEARQAPGLQGTKYRRAVEQQGLLWTADLADALTGAQSGGKLVFVAFTGQADTNSRFNEVAVFSRDPVKDALRQHALVLLYVDQVPESFYVEPPTREQQQTDARANQELEEKQFQTVFVPFYVLLEPLGEGKFEVVAKYDQGKINDVDQFVRFLRMPRKKSKPADVAHGQTLLTLDITRVAAIDIRYPDAMPLEFRRPARLRAPGGSSEVPPVWDLHVGGQTVKTHPGIVPDLLAVLRRIEIKAVLDDENSRRAWFGQDPIDLGIDEKHRAEVSLWVDAGAVDSEDKSDTDRERKLKEAGPTVILEVGHQDPKRGVVYVRRRLASGQWNTLAVPDPWFILPPEQPAPPEMVITSPTRVARQTIGLRNLVKGGPLAFRSRQLPRFDPKQAVRITYDSGSGQDVLERLDSSWTLKTGAKGERTRSVGFLPFRLAQLGAERLVAQGTLDLAPYGLDKPAIRIVVDVRERDGKISFYAYSIGKPTDDSREGYYARVHVQPASGPPPEANDFVLVLDGPLVDNLVRALDDALVPPPVPDGFPVARWHSDWLEKEAQVEIVLPESVDTKRIERLIADLDDGRFQVREQASTELAALAERAEPALRKALPVAPSEEARRRLGMLLDRLAASSAEEVRQAGASRVAWTLKCRVLLYPSRLAELQEAVAALQRQPHRCLEQTVSNNYLNLLILDYLRQQGRSNEPVARRVLESLASGYQRLLAGECSAGPDKRGGFEWFGSSAAPTPALTAMAWVQLRALHRVYDRLDTDILERSRSSLMSSLDGGGFRSNPRALQVFGQATEDVTNAYILWLLSETSGPDRSTFPTAAEKMQIDHVLDMVTSRAEKSNDAYLLALVANTLLNQHEAGKARALLRKLAYLQHKSEGYLGLGPIEAGTAAPRTTITGSAGRDLPVETTALTLLAWLKANRPEFQPHIQAAAHWLVQQRDGEGAFGATQATYLALKALLAQAQATDIAVGPGDLVLSVRGQVLASKHFEAGADRVLVVDVPYAEKSLEPGKNTITLRLTSTKPLPYTLAWSYHTLKPAGAEDCPVHLRTTLDRPRAVPGETVRLTVTVENRSQQGQGMTVAVVSLPPGLALPEDRKQLHDLCALKNGGTTPGLVGAWEVLGRDLVLYWRDLAPDARIEMPLDLVCRRAGEHRGAASRVYPYYNRDQTCWCDPLSIVIKAK
jgi:serine/threonine protein kinase